MRVRQSRSRPVDKIATRQNRGTQPVPDTEPQSETFLAPIDGWVIDENLAATRPNSARQMTNFWPTRTGVRLRGGSTRRATIPEKCQKLFAYRSGQLNFLMAFGDGGVYDVTSPVDPLAAIPSSVTGRTSGDVSAVNFSTGGVNILYTVNGADPAIFFNGTTWVTPAVTDFDTSTASFVFEAGSRIWFVSEGSSTVHYLPINSFAGAAERLPLEATIKGGGAILFGGTMSSDSGSGFNDRLVFVTTEGTFLLYSSTDPLTATLVGRYTLGSRPLGKNSFLEIGGDIEVLTDEGMVSLRQAILRNGVELSLTNRSRAIEPYWQTQAVSKKLSDWQVKLWPSRNAAIVTLPATNTNQPEESFIVNIETNAWGYTLGWDTQSIEEFNGDMIYGDSSGGIYFMDSGGSDNGVLYSGTCLLNPKHLGQPDNEKVAHQISTVLKGSTAFSAKVTVGVNYADDVPPAPSSSVESVVDTWDNALWDVAKWDSGGAEEIIRVRNSVGETGFTFSPRIQISSGGNITPNVEIVSQTMTYTPGGAMR